MSGRTTHHSLEERLEVVLLYLSGQVGSSRLAKQYGVSGILCRIGCVPIDTMGWRA